MSSLATPDVSTGPLTAHPTLRAGSERCSLSPGVHGLGGRAPDAIKLAALENQPRAAILTVSEDGATLLQRTTASIMVRIDGETVGIGAVEVHHGAAIEFGDCRLIFETDGGLAPAGRRVAGERATLGTTTASPAQPVAPAQPHSLVSGAAPRSAEPPAHADAKQTSSAALVVVRTGARHPLAARRIYIGRDESCEVIVRGNSVSRRHASIAPVNGGFLLRDESANGTLVNGVRVVGTYLLGDGDVVRVQDEELRVELDASTDRPVVREEQTTRLDLAHIAPGVTEERAREIASRAPTASLEIVRGPFSGACFQVERAVCSIGRGEENDVRIRDDTVSLTHATLLRKRGAWFVVDLRSMNGTYVEGSRVSGERELCPGARLRLGAVELVFRAIDCATPAPPEAARLGLWKRIRGLIRSVKPPT
jgi:pSer/pThr/pTyr-binding forkhead associated (FHA) protein